MKMLYLVFFEKEIIIQYPKNLFSLKKEIASNYQISLSDVSEIDIAYYNNEIKKFIKSEIDFKLFLHSRIYKLILNIKESSDLFQKNLLDLQKKSKEDMLQVEILKKKKEENKKMQEIKYKETQKILNDLNNEVKILDQKKLDYVKSLTKTMKAPKNKEKELQKKITQLGKEIEVPLEINIEKKDSVKEEKDNEKEKKLLELIKKNDDCVNVQEQLYSIPRKNMIDIDKQIKEINKKCLEIIKTSQKEMNILKNEENILVKEIISYEKKLGLFVDEKTPMKKYGFYFPNRDNAQIKTIKNKEENKSIKISNKKNIDLILPIKNNQIKINKKIENVVNMLKDNLNEEIEKKIIKVNDKIKKIREKALENNLKIENEDEKYLDKCQKENSDVKKEVDKWIEYILVHSNEILESIEKKNENYIEKINEIEKKVENSIEKSSKEKLIDNLFICNGCNMTIIGEKYHCSVCKYFYYCEKCQEKNKGQHEHPLLKINN
jgi:hypothetical protein